MRILHAVEFYAPSRGGAQEVVRRISEAMAARGHEVTVATTRLAARSFTELNGVRLVEFDVAGNAARGIVGSSWAYQQFLTESRFDVVMTYAAQQWTTDLLLDCVRDIDAVTLCAPCGYSGLDDPGYVRYFEALPARLAQLDATIYHSPSYQDIEFARRHGLTDLHVIPNGAAEDEFEALDGDAASAFRARHQVEGTMVLTVGSHTGLKGHRQAMLVFAASTTGRATLAVVGNGQRGSGCADACRRWARRLNPLLQPLGKKVLVLDLPREEVVAAYQAADVFLFLSMVECSPVVLYEAVASATPFISTDVGNAGEIAVWTGAGWVTPTVEVRGGRRVSVAPVAVRQLGILARDGATRRDMGERGRHAWLERFRWSALADEYLALYEHLLERRLARSAEPGAGRGVV